MRYQQENLNTRIDHSAAQGIRIKRLRNLTCLSRRAFALKHHISPGTLQNWEDGRYNGLTKSAVKQLLAALRAENILCSATWLVTGDGNEPIFSPPQNHSDVHSDSLVVPTHALNDEMRIITEEIKLFNQLNANSHVTILTDDTMEPHYQKGNLVAGKRRYHADIKALINQTCIIQLQTGIVVIRQLEASREENLYNLIATNQSTQVNPANYYNQAIFSAAPIIWIRKKDEDR